MEPQTDVADVMPRLLTVSEAIDVLGICRTSFYKLVKRGRLPVVHISGRRLVDPADLQALISESKRKAA